jgi:hypothetical protein
MIIHGRRKMAMNFANAAVEFAGDLRFLVTVLAMINLVPTEYQHSEATARLP